MHNMIAMGDWFKAHIGVDTTELPNLPVAVQLKAYDDAGTGVGLVLILELVSSSQDEEPQATQYEMTSVPVIKISNIWMTVEDENVADIIAGVIRLVAPQSD